MHKDLLLLGKRWLLTPWRAWLKQKPSCGDIRWMYCSVPGHSLPCDMLLLLQTSAVHHQSPWGRGSRPLLTLSLRRHKVGEKNSISTSVIQDGLLLLKWIIYGKSVDFWNSNSTRKLSRENEIIHHELKFCLHRKVALVYLKPIFKPVTPPHLRIGALILI